jgi:hypothetical protein
VAVPTGWQAEHPLTGALLPVWLVAGPPAAASDVAATDERADGDDASVLLGVPAADPRAARFADAHGIARTLHGPHDSTADARARVMQALQERGLGRPDVHVRTPHPCLCRCACACVPVSVPAFRGRRCMALSGEWESIDTLCMPMCVPMCACLPLSLSLSLSLCVSLCLCG